MKRLRGINFGGWLSQIDAIEEKDPTGFKGIDNHMRHFLGPDDFTRVAKWGFNHVRLPVDYNYFFDDSLNPVKSRFAVLDEAVAAAQANRLTVMLDLHKCPGHTFHDETKSVQQLFVGQRHLEMSIQVWTYLAERYAGFTNTMFEVLNEPVAPTSALWNQVRDRLCKAIRTVAKDTPLVVGSNMWNWPSTYPEMTRVDDDNVLYCFHFYEPLLFTHQKAPWLGEPEFSREYDYPGDYGSGVVRQYDLRMSAGVWDKERFERELEPVLAFQSRHNVPVICNEFGVYAGVPSALRVRWTADFLETLAQHQIGFSYWNYKNLDFGIISEGEALHQQREQYRHSDGIDEDMLNLLKSR